MQLNFSNSLATNNYFVPLPTKEEELSTSSDESHWSLENSNSDVEMDESTFLTSQKNEWEDLQKSYKEIFENNHMQPRQAERFPQMDDIGMDKWKIVSAKKGEPLYLGSSGINTCIAICAHAQTKEDQVFVGLVHLCINSAEWGLETITKELKKKGCCDSEIQIYLIGGVLSVNIDEPNNCLETQQDLLILSDTYPILGAKFNILSGENTLSVVISHEKIFYQEDKKGRLFKSFDKVKA